MSVSVDTRLVNAPFFSGSAIVEEAETVVQDGGRSGNMVFGTVMCYDASAAKWNSLTSVTQTLFTRAILQGGANGANLAAWQAVTAGAFTVTVNGVAVALTGLDFSAITILDEIASIINYHAAGRVICLYDSKLDKFKFLSPDAGVGNTISYLTAPAAGTDISGSGFLNGLTGTGVLTAATGNVDACLPLGILQKTLTEAAIQAADVTDVPIIVGGSFLAVDRNQLTLENSLNFTDVITAGGVDQTIEDFLRGRGIYLKDSIDVDEYENA